MSMMNPWKDISPYKTSDAANFKGRDEDTRKFSRILRQNDFSVLYAESGIGKTSFINAGIMPAFVDTDYYFIRVEFPLDVLKETDERKTDDLIAHLEEWLCNKIFPVNPNEDNRIKGELIVDLAEIHSASPDLEHNLWWKLHAYRYQVDGKPVKPFIVFDQFEEVFQKASPALLHELFAILDSLSSRIPPRIVLDRLYEFEEKGVYVSLESSINFKVLFSLRKEYLAEFDYWTNDVYSNSQLLQSRMILLPFTKAQAVEVITQQRMNGEFVNTLVDVKDDILDLFEQRSDNSTIKNRNKYCYEAFLLSVVCSRLYTIAIKAQKEKLTKEDMTNINLNELILAFYNESVRDFIPKRHLRIIEEELVDNSGERNRIKLTTDNLSALKFEKRYLTELKNRHIVKSADGYVELIHDRVAEAVFYKRKESNRKQLYLFQRVAIACLILLFAGIAILLGWSTPLGTSYQSREFVKTHFTLSEDGKYYFSEPSAETVVINNGGSSSSSIEHCPLLKSIEIHSRKPASASLYISDCPQLVSLSFANAIDHLYGNIKNCNNIHFIRLPQNIVYISGSLFEHIDSLEFEVPENARNKFVWENGVLWDLKRKSIVYAQKGAETLQIFPKALNQKDTLEYNGRFFIDAQYEKPRIVIENDTILVRVNMYHNTAIDLSEKIYNGIKHIGKKAFYNCRNLQEIILPDSLESIGESAFSGCTALRSIKIPPSLRTIDDGAFAGCTNLSEIVLPDSLKSIGMYAFSGCSSLQRVHLPYSVSLSRIPYSVCTQFEGCDSLDEYSFSPNSGFNEREGIIFFEKQPCFFIANKLNYKDSLLSFKDDILTYTYEFTADNGKRYTQDHYVAKKLHVAFVQYKGRITDLNPIVHNPDSVVYLPDVRGNVCFIGSHKMHELHVANTSPQKFNIHLPEYIQSKIVLYVPYGCKKYFESSKLGSFKEIREDTKFLRLKNLLDEMLTTSLAQSNVLYILCITIILLVFFFLFIFYKKRYRKMHPGEKINVFQINVKGVWIAFSTLIIFLLTWVSIYWAIYFALDFHLGIIASYIGHLIGIMGALFATWVLVYAHNVDIWMSVRIGVRQFIAKCRTMTLEEAKGILYELSNQLLYMLRRNVKYVLSIVLLCILACAYVYKRNSWTEAIERAEMLIPDEIEMKDAIKIDSLLHVSMPGWKFLLSGKQQNDLRAIYNKIGDEFPNTRVINEFSEKGHKGTVNSVAFSHNDSMIVTGSDDGTAIIWNAYTGDTIRTLRGHKRSVESVAFSHNDSMIVTGSGRQAIVWNALTGDTVRSFRGHKGLVTFVSFTHNDDMIVTASLYDNTAIVWNALTGDSIYTLRGSKRGVESVAFNHNDSMIVTVGLDNTAIVWNALTGDIIRTLRGHKGSVESVAFSHNDSMIVTASWDRTAIVWNALTGDTIRTLRGHKGLVRSVAFSHNDDMIVTGSNDTAIAWNALTGDTIRTFSGLNNIRSLAFNSDDTRLLIGTSDEIVIWDTQTLAHTHMHITNEVKGDYQIATSPVTEKICIYNEAAIIWNTVTGDTLHTLNKSINRAVFSPDGNSVAFALNYNNRIACLRSLTDDIVYFQYSHNNYIRSLAFNHDGNRIVSGSADNTAIVWNALTGDTIRTLRGHDGGVDFVAYSHNDSLIVTVSKDTVIMWDALTGDFISSWKSPYSITSISFSLDDSQIILGSYSRLVWLSDWKSVNPKVKEFYSLSSITQICPELQLCMDSDNRVYDLGSGNVLFQINNHDDNIVYFSSNKNEFYVQSANRVQKIRFMTLDELTESCHKILSDKNIN